MAPRNSPNSRAHVRRVTCDVTPADRVRTGHGSLVARRRTVAQPGGMARVLGFWSPGLVALLSVVLRPSGHYIQIQICRTQQPSLRSLHACFWLQESVSRDLSSVSLASIEDMVVLVITDGRLDATRAHHHLLLVGAAACTFPRLRKPPTQRSDGVLSLAGQPHALPGGQDDAPDGCGRSSARAAAVSAIASVSSAGICSGCVRETCADGHCGWSRHVARARAP